MNVLGNIPRKTFLAYSGGADSASALAFLLSGRREVTLCYFNHETDHGFEAKEHVKDVASKLGLELLFSSMSEVDAKIQNGQSKECQWRDARYKFFHSLPGPVCMSHHLDDQLENWIFTGAHGHPRLIPYANNNVYRPFLCFTKEELTRFAKKMKIGWIEDPSNKDLSYKRNYIRHIVVPAYANINPGIQKTLRKKICANFTKES